MYKRQLTIHGVGNNGYISKRTLMPTERKIHRFSIVPDKNQNGKLVTEKMNYRDISLSECLLRLKNGIPVCCHKTAEKMQKDPTAMNCF